MTKHTPSSGLKVACFVLKLAGTTGLEPATSAVTGQHSNQLNYVPFDCESLAARRCASFVLRFVRR